MTRRYRVVVESLEETAARKKHSFRGEELAAFNVTAEFDLTPRAVLRVVSDALEDGSCSEAPS